ncbi:MAG: hypothetical protein SNJ77_03245 [Cytophagales bacterium]
MKYAELITKDFPIILIKTNPIDPTPQQIEEFFKEVDDYLSQTEGDVVTISWNEKAVFISSEARILIGKKANEITEKHKTRTKASIIVSEGMVAQMMLKAIALVYKPMKDAIIVSKLEDGYKKAKEILKLETA